jgi:hypothetical protein
MCAGTTVQEKRDDEVSQNPSDGDAQEQGGALAAESSMHGSDHEGEHVATAELPALLRERLEVNAENLDYDESDVDFDSTMAEMIDDAAPLGEAYDAAPFAEADDASSDEDQEHGYDSGLDDEYFSVRNGINAAMHGFLNRLQNLEGVIIPRMHMYAPCLLCMHVYAAEDAVRLSFFVLHEYNEGSFA